MIMDNYVLTYNDVSVGVKTEVMPRVVCLIIVDGEIMFVLKAGDIATAKQIMKEISPALEEFDVIFRPFIIK